MKTLNDRIKNAIWGAIIGDSFGIPFEWMKRGEFEVPYCLTDDLRRGFSAGVWSDDSSMILCTVESLINNGADMKAMGDNFVNSWYDSAYWTPHGRVFDIGNTTRYAMESIKNGDYINGCCERDKGNGSLMRILPMACYLNGAGKEQIKDIVENCSALTHATKDCKIACVWYSLLVTHMLSLNNKFNYSVLKRAEKDITSLYTEEELKNFERILNDEVQFYTPEQLKNTGYVVHSLEVVVNCLFNGYNYMHAIQRAVSIGGDTDTNACLVGGLFALTEKVPDEMKNQIVRKHEIESLINKIDWDWE